jgi:hypothetical protein
VAPSLEMYHDGGVTEKNRLAKVVGGKDFRT